MFLSGWMAHIFYWMMWIVPLFPIVARAVTKAALIEVRDRCMRPVQSHGWRLDGSLAPVLMAVAML